MNPYNPFNMAMRLPAPNTIARGKTNYYFPYANTPADYERAGQTLRNPLPSDSINLAEGQRLFNLYCWQCHGKEGKNDGPVMALGKFPKPSWPAYASDYIRGLSDGKIYFSITYGKNLMGPHGSIVTPDQRWLITHYIRYLSKETAATTPATSPSDSTKTNPVPATSAATGATTSTSTTSTPSNL